MCDEEDVEYAWRNYDLANAEAVQLGNGLRDIISLTNSEAEYKPGSEYQKGWDDAMAAVREVAQKALHG